MIKINKFDYLNSLYKKYYGNSCSLLDKNLSMALTSKDLPKILSTTSLMPMYSRTFFNDERIISYHLGGYAESFSDAFFRLSGEAVERYSALMISKIFENNFVLTSINELKQKNLLFLPSDYLNVYTANQYEKLNSYNQNFSEKKLSDSDQINWIKMTNYVDWKDYYIPIQLLFLSGHFFDKKQYNPSFTTGTAAHITREKSIINAVIESFQLHNFVRAWYLDNSLFNFLDIGIELETKFSKMFPNKNYGFNFFYISSENNLPIRTVLCFIEGKGKYNFPKFAFGIQSGIQIKDCIYRAFMEALAVFNFALYGIIFNDHNELNNANHQSSLSLDANVIKYALNLNEKPQEWVNSVFSKVNKKLSLRTLPFYENDFDVNDDSKILKSLLLKVSEKYKYMFIVDVTSPELSQNYFVSRVFIPENIPIVFPEFFPWDHPYVKNLKTKPSSNAYIHPLP